MIRLSLALFAIWILIACNFHSLHGDGRMDSHVQESTCWWLWQISASLWSEPLMQTIWLRAGNFALFILLLLIYYTLTFHVLLIYFLWMASHLIRICRLTDFVNRILCLISISPLFSISNIQMDIAVPHSTGNERALEVEECACPQGYTGPSCQVYYDFK